jgi:hypothetical protein
MPETEHDFPVNAASKALVEKSLHDPKHAKPKPGQTTETDEVPVNDQPPGWWKKPGDKPPVKP